MIDLLDRFWTERERLRIMHNSDRLDVFWQHTDLFTYQINENVPSKHTTSSIWLILIYFSTL